MSQQNCNILCWNVRGLNAAASRASVRNMVISTNATIACLQETKIAHWSSQLVAETLGQQFAHSFATLTANGIRGGILLGVSENYFAIQNHHATTYTISTDVPMKADNTTWTITGVYGPIY